MSPLPMDEVKRRAGGAHALARRLGISRQAVTRWQKVPIGRVRQVAAIIGVPARCIRPDIFDQPTD